MLFQIWNLNFISVYEMFIVREETIGGVKIRDLSHVHACPTNICKNFNFKPSYDLFVD